MEQGLIAYLIAQCTSVGGRVYPTPPQGVVFPYIQVTRVSGAPEYDNEGEAGIDHARMQIDCRAATYGDAKDLAKSVRSAVSGKSNLICNGVVFTSIMISNEFVFRESGQNLTRYIYTTVLELDIWGTLT